MTARRIDEYDKQTLHRQVGFVFQDSIIFNLTLRENIAFSKTVTDEDLEKAITTAELKDFIDGLPQKLDTIVSERGTSLSGGQKQRIMLARALALNPQVLLLDDFTARVDSTTERRILENVHENYPGITLLSVTQKIASVEDYDQIILLMEGEVLASGTHRQLMETSPEYVQIYDSQRSTSHYELLHTQQAGNQEPKATLVTALRRFRAAHRRRRTKCGAGVCRYRHQLRIIPAWLPSLLGAPWIRIFRTGISPESFVRVSTACSLCVRPFRQLLSDESHGYRRAQTCSSSCEMRLFTKLQQLPLAFFNQNKAGDLISSINNDTDKLNQFFSQSLVQLAGNLFLMIGAGDISRGAQCAVGCCRSDAGSRRPDLYARWFQRG